MSAPGDGRTAPDTGGARFRFANVEFDEVEGQLRVAGQPVDVEPRPLRLLAELLRRVNEVVTKEELFESVWEGRPTVDHVLANAVSKLRTALGEECAGRIVTVPRVGYRFTGPIQRLQARAAEHLFQAGEPVPGREAFSLTRPLGQGSNSDVWLARHAKLGQEHVFKFADDGARLSALKREYTLYRVLMQELGPRDDFAIVAGSNFTSAPYFLECEYGGQSLLEWAEEGGRLTAMPVAERLALFLQIARAVAAAHSVGVLHKDLKPGNVLIAGVPGAPGKWQVRLTDFGSGRLLDPARLQALHLTALGMTQTQDGADDSRSGTLMYLAPEVIVGQAPSMQSDVYALGVVLFQMLVGDMRRPLATGWQRDIADELLCEDVTASTEGANVARLAAVADLVHRLEHLEQRRAQKAAQREEAARAAAAQLALGHMRSRRPWVIAAFVCLVCGLVVSLWLGARANTAMRKAEAESVRARTINDFMNKDVLQSADVNRAGSIKALSMSDVLARASTRASERFKGQPQTEASVRRQLGEIYLRIASAGAAADEFRKAIALLQALVGAGDAELLASRFGLVQALSMSYFAQDAAPMLVAAERDAGAVLLAGNTELAVLARRARLENLLELQQNKAALPVALALVSATDAWPGADLPDRFEARQKLAEVYLRLDDASHADAVLAELLKPPYDAKSVGEVTVARARLNLAKVLMEKDRNPEAQTILLQVRDTLTAALGPTAPLVGHANYMLGDIYITAGNFVAAGAALGLAQTAFAAALGPEHGHTVSVATNFFIVELTQGHAAAALKGFDALRPWYVAKGHAADGIDFYRASALNDLGRPAEALAILDTLSAQRLAALSWSVDDWRWHIQAERGRVLLALGRKAEGRNLMRTAIAEMQKLGSSEWKLAHYRNAAGL